MSPYNFQKFTGVGEKYDPRISITKSNFIGLPREFCKRNNIQDYGYAVLFYDPEVKAIAIQFHRAEVDDCYKVNYSKESHSASISARSFFRFYPIDTKKYAGRYDAKVDQDAEHGQLFVIELKEHNDEP